MNNVLTRRSAAVVRVLRRWFDRNFSQTEPALCQMSLLVSALIVGLELNATYWPGPLGAALFVLGTLVIMEAALWLARWFLRKVLGHGLGWLMSLLLLCYTVARTVRRGAGEGWTWRVYLFSAVIVAALWLLTASLWSLLRHRRFRPTTVLAFLAGAAATGMLGVFLFTDGFDDHYVQRYLALMSSPPSTLEALEPSLGPGSYAVETVDYGPEEELEAGTISLTRYMSRDTDELSGAYVDNYMDYSLSQVPLRGRVWYPAGEKNCPVLFIAHGNHEITTESYLGYAYLGEYLASHGYVVVSVDQNACNMLSGENDGRAVLLLENIGLLLGYNEEEGNPLEGVLDADNIAIAGHSRGGEMVATANLFNGYDNYPENGNVDFDYHYNIRSIIAIAPTVDQYKPADHSVELEDVNYLLLHGACDRDVTNFQGMAQYEHISYTGQGDYLKTALYIAGANHGQFNSLWGSYDQRGPFSSLLNVESLLSEEDQQEIAKIFIKVFLDVTLLGDDSCRSLLTDWDSCAGQLPETVYVQCYETSSFIPIADFEEDSDLTTAAMPGVTAEASGVSLWTEEQINIDGETDQGTHALRLRWGSQGQYTLTLPELDMTGSALVFDLCDLDSGAVERGDLALLDGTVVLTDADGNTASARISDFAAVFPILPVRTDKLDFLFDTCTYKKAFATVSIPVDAFVPGEGTAIDSSRITSITLKLDGGGEAAVDNIGLEAVRSSHHAS